MSLIQLNDCDPKTAVFLDKQIKTYLILSVKKNATKKHK